jgi:hypothetical protein
VTLGGEHRQAAGAGAHIAAPLPTALVDRGTRRLLCGRDRNGQALAHVFSWMSWIGQIAVNALIGYLRELSSLGRLDRTRETEEFKMPTNGGPNGGEGGGGGNTQEQEYELLGYTQIINFSANPSPVSPFGTTTLSWEVRFPTHLHSEVTISVAGSEVQGISPGTLSGSATVTLEQTTIFGLVATTPAVQRGIASLTVPVDQTECTRTSIPTGIVTNLIGQGINQALQGRLKDPPTVTAGDNGTISIAMTLNLKGQDTMDISVVLVVQSIEHQVSVTAPSVVVDVHLSGIASLCEGACSEIAQAFMTEIANNQIVPALLQGLNDRIQQTASSAKAADPQHRDFVLTSLTLTSIEVTFIICPRGTGVFE